MRHSLAALLLVILAARSIESAETIDGRAVPRLLPQAGWTPSRLAQQFRATADDGWIALSVGGENKQMTWTLAPSAAEMAGEPRWLVLHYRASNINTRAGDMVLAAQTGSPTWYPLVSTRDLVADNQPHAVVVDLASYQFQSPIERFLFRVGPSTADEGQLRLKVEQTDTPPKTDRVVTYRWPKAESARLEFEAQKWTPAPNWIPRPPTQHSLDTTPTTVRYRMEGARKSMRWTARLPRQLDFAKTPYVAMRYRATGEFGPHGYVFYLAVNADGKQKSVYAMQPGDVVADGRWHVFASRMDSKETTVGGIAVGIDSLGDRAELELDYIEFSSQPTRTAITDAFACEPRATAWPTGRDGFTTLALPAEGRHNPYLLPRMGIGAWFDNAEINVEGVPFRVPTDPMTLPSTGTADTDDVQVPLSGKCREILVLLAAAFPYAELFGSNAQRMAPLKQLDEPERASLELVYADGTRDEMIPLQAAAKQYGFAHNLAIYALHPDSEKPLASLVVHDRIRSGAFAVVGITLNEGKPRVAEPVLPQVWYPPVRKAAPAEAHVALTADGPLGWQSIESPMLGGRVELAGQPLFRLTIGDREIDSRKFTIGQTSRRDDETAIEATLREGDLNLRARLRLRHTVTATDVLDLQLTNQGGKAVTGTLLFPTLAGLRLGKQDDTWYFCGRRGGVINNVPARMRDEIGEAHPLALDGFFNPHLGAGVALMPRIDPAANPELDMAGLYRWYRVGKDAEGGNYAVEYLPETVNAGSTWKALPITVTVMPGDWRDQLREYVAWLRTWYRPTAARKDWYRKLWSFVSYGPYYPKTTPIDERLDFLTLAKLRNNKVPGSADYVHLFGWAITDKYGHWGAYDHYEDLGGAEHFRQSVAKAKSAGQPIGLYLDGYLVSTASDKPSHDKVEAWSIRTPDGKKLYHASYDAHSMCPYVPAWRDYLASVYRRVAGEVQPSGMYLDEYGRCFPERACSSSEHGHATPQGMCPGEWLLSRQVRAAVPPEIAFYCEFVPADVATQYLDGAYGHVSLNNHTEGYERLAPHFVNLHRFAIPDFKTFELIYYTPLRNGNWFLLKHPFFNGDGYYLTDAKMDGWDDAVSRFMTRVFAVQHRYADAFTSSDVQPLVATAQRGLYANCFRTPSRTVWTLYNANYRSVRGTLLSAPHVAGARYIDAWNGQPLQTRPNGPQIDFIGQIGPRSVGCLVQEMP